MTKRSEIVPDPFTLLIVDDNMNNIQVLAGMLTGNGYNVEFATNGESALQWIEEENFDLILLDVMMPNMDGFEVCERIRRIKKFRNLPVIFLTAKADKDSIVKGFNKGGNDYLTKPIDKRELLARVNTQLELKNSRDKLSKMNEWLEQRVNERTDQLNSALREVTELNKKLLELDQVKSEFLKMISHEIRTPLNGIIGFTDIIKNTNEAEPLMEYIDLLEQSARRLDKFSMNALLLTSLRLGNYYIEKESILISDELAVILTGIKNKITEKSISVTIDCPTKIMVLADRKLFTTALTIVIDNAIWFAPENGTIKISAKKIADHIEINISDNGDGFSPEALKNLFEFFGSGGQHYDQRQGMGLALAHQIMLAHDAKIEVHNLPEGGALVTLIIDHPHT